MVTIQLMKGKAPRKHCLHKKKQPRFYWSCTSVVMKDAIPLTPPSTWAEGTLFPNENKDISQLEIYYRSHYKKLKKKHRDHNSAKSQFVDSFELIMKINANISRLLKCAVKCLVSLLVPFRYMTNSLTYWK